VASATKLQTARTIWGQSFDGTGNVDGKIYQNNKWILGVHSDGNLYMGFDTYNRSDTLLFGRNLYMFTPIGQAMTINSSGNVLIGTTTDSGYKLDVNGDIAIRRVGSSAEYFVINTNDVSVNYRGYDTSDGWTRHLFYSNDNLLLGLNYDNNNIAYFTGGALFEGAVTMLSTLNVSGNAHFTGLITADSGIKIGDATITWDASANALKIDKSVYSIGGFGTK
jgi:hypothetical protein